MALKAMHLHPSELYRALVRNGVNYFCGVPDSLLSSFGFYLEDHAKNSHDVAVNEGNAIALAIGYYLAARKVALVYMQNSGLGNAINPLTSLVDPLVMGIPMLLLIGWRGQPSKEDEPQHKKQGKITTKLLNDMDIPYLVLSRASGKAAKQIAEAVRNTKQFQRPYALLVESNTLEPHHNQTKDTHYQLSREEAVESIVNHLGKTGAIVATTGKTSRELFEHRATNRQKHHQDLLIIGGMGHASSIALAIAQQKPKRKIYCIDGDGALLMHMGSLAIIGNKAPGNFYHFVINNGSHESVGGQPTISFNINIPAIAKACGYKHTYLVTNKNSLNKTLISIRNRSGPIFIEIRVNKKSRSDLSRPTIHPSKNKETFIAFIKDS